jgi:hypothetical protein
MDQAKLDLLVSIAGTRSNILFFPPVSPKKQKKNSPDNVYEFSGKYDVYVIIIANLIYKTIIGKCVLLHRHAYKVDTTVFFFFLVGWVGGQRVKE